MIKMINRITGTEMLVADDRLDEYVAAGHAPVLKSPKEVHAEMHKAPEEKPATVKRGTKKKV